MKTFIYLLFLALFGCTVTGVNDEATSKHAEKAESNDPPISDRIYLFQHKLISKWVFESEGAFYTDLRQGDIGQLIAAAEEIVTPEYAKQVLVTPVENKEAVLITFPKPESPPNCFYAIVEKTGDSFRYITYESTIDIMGSGAFGVVGGWDSEGGHSNYGIRKYKTSAEFIKDVLGDK